MKSVKEYMEGGCHKCGSLLEELEQAFPVLLRVEMNMLHGTGSASMVLLCGTCAEEGPLLGLSSEYTRREDMARKIRHVKRVKDSAAFKTWRGNRKIPREEDAQWALGIDELMTEGERNARIARASTLTGNPIVGEYLMLCLQVVGAEGSEEDGE